MNIYDATLFTAPDCLPCCAPPAPADCSCALLIPPQASPYADYATADGVVTDPLLVADCLAYNDVSLDMTSFSAAFDGTTFTADGAWSSAASSFGYVWISISAKSGATLTFDSTAGSSFDGVIYTCDGTEVEVIGPAASPITSAALPADGEYYLKMLPNDPPPGGSGFTACTITVTSSDDFVVNPVIALWDDSGTTRNLWACPKLLIPPRTESTGDWYVDCTAADGEMTSAQYVSNCVGYCSDLPDTFTATDGGTTLTLNATCDLIVDPRFAMWGGINAVNGQTLSAAFTYSGDHGSPTAGFTIYDDTGTLVQTLSGAGGTLTSSALPYKGRYTIRATGGRNDGVASDAFSTTAVISSSGTMSVNPIQARWDAGLTCAGTLDCGDTC